MCSRPLAVGPSAVMLAALASLACGQDLAKPPRALRLVGEFDVGQGGVVTSLAFSPDGKLLAAGSDAGEVVVSRVDTGELVVRLLAARETPRLTFSPDGRRLAAAGARDLRVFAIPGGEMVAAREVFAESPVAWSADGKTMVAQATVDSIAILAGDDLAERGRLALRQRGSVRSFTWARDGRSVTLVQYRGGLFTLDLQTGEQELLAEGQLVGAVSFDGDRWLVAREGRSALPPTPNIEDLGRARNLVAAPDAGQLLLCWNEVSWRSRDGRVLCSLPAADAVALRPSGDLAAVARSGVVQLVAPDGSVVRELRGHRERPSQVVIAGGGPPGGGCVVASTWTFFEPATRPNLFVYDVAKGERHDVTMTPSPRTLRASPASPDVLITGKRNRLWNPRTRSTTFDLGVGTLPSSPVWSPDARWIWTGRPRMAALRGEVDMVFDLSSRGERGFATPRGSEPLAWRHDGEALLSSLQIAHGLGGMGDLLVTVGGKVVATATFQVLVHQAVWSPDGRTIALATNGGIKILDGETLATKAEGPRGSAWVRYLDAHHLVCSADNRVTVLRVDSGDVVLTQPLRAGLDHRPSHFFGFLGPPGDALADGSIVVAADGVGVSVFEVVR